MSTYLLTLRSVGVNDLLSIQITNRLLTISNKPSLESLVTVFKRTNCTNFKMSLLVGKDDAGKSADSPTKGQVRR